MDASRILITICGFALSVCLFFSIGALSSLRHAVAESHAVKKEAEELVDKIEDRLAVPKQEITDSDTDTVPTVKDEKNDREYRICAVDRIIGVYNECGDLLRILDVPIDSLPSTDREKLQAGIKADSWQEVESLLQDYEA
ncbi:MAG: hypothetical protein IJW49_03820 [Clostridia bacterium]|nr:hypothetical protein [Clostridia bacterium]